MGAILGGQNINQGLGRPPGPNFEAMQGVPENQATLIPNYPLPAGGRPGDVIHPDSGSLPTQWGLPGWNPPLPSGPDGATFDASGQPLHLSNDRPLVEGHEEQPYRPPPAGMIEVPGQPAHSGGSYMPDSISTDLMNQMLEDNPWGWGGSHSTGPAGPPGGGPFIVPPQDFGPDPSKPKPLPGPNFEAMPGFPV